MVVEELVYGKRFGKRGKSCGFRKHGMGDDFFDEGHNGTIGMMIEKCGKEIRRKREMDNEKQKCYVN